MKRTINIVAVLGLVFGLGLVVLASKSKAFEPDMEVKINGLVCSSCAIGIKKYIKALKPYCKKIINLLYFQGFTQAEASEELDMPLGTIKTRNRNCMNKLREILTT